jgi:hypothetical protein
MHSILLATQQIAQGRQGPMQGGAAGAQRSHRRGVCERKPALDGQAGSDDVAGFHVGILEKTVLVWSG